MNCTVTGAGFLTSVQDTGRSGHRQSGVSLGGALDPHALKVANLLVANEPSEAGLEVTLGRVCLRFADDRLVAWCGGAFEVQLGTLSLPAGHTGLIHRGKNLLVTPLAAAARGWLAISGGIAVPRVLGSRSTDLQNRFGGFKGRALQDGDVLPLGEQTDHAARIARRLESARVAGWAAPNEWSQTRAGHSFLRIVRGRDWSQFESDVLTASAFGVTPDADRMGLRLHGPGLKRNTEENLISQPVAPGTIQVLPSGQAILLLGDCQTIGGYPKIAHVITVDLAAAVQLRPGDAVRFAEVPLVEAQQLMVERERDLARFRIGLALQTS